MSLYLAPYVGAGTKQDPFRPRGSEGAWSAVDLRPDPSVVDGFALLYHPSASSDGLLTAIGTDKDDTLPRSVENNLGSKLCLSFDGSNRTCGDLLGDLLLRPPGVKGWKPIKPALVNGARVYEVLLNRTRWFLQPVIAGGASDNFNRANETPLASPWAENGAGSKFNLASNQVTKVNEANDACAYYGGAASGGDQFTEIQITGFGGDNDCGPAVRIGSGATLNAYIASYFGNFYKLVAGAFTDLGNHGDTPTANHYYRMTASGSSMNLFRDASQPPTTNRGNFTDSSLTTGQPGFNSFTNLSTFDNFRGGDGDGSPDILWAQSVM